MPARWIAAVAAGAGLLLLRERGFLGVRFTNPLPHYDVTSGWGDPRSSGFHAAIDIAAPRGRAISAAASGEVIQARAANTGTAGRFVVIRSSPDVAIRYIHLESLSVGMGDRVRRGQTIGTVGDSGGARGTHLHLDVFLSQRGLQAFIRQFGTPDPPFPRPRKWGVQVPAESLIPVSGFRDPVLARVKRRGVVVA